MLSIVFFFEMDFFFKSDFNTSAFSKIERLSFFKTKLVSNNEKICLHYNFLNYFLCK